MTLKLMATIRDSATDDAHTEEIVPAKKSKVVETI